MKSFPVIVLVLALGSLTLGEDINPEDLEASEVLANQELFKSYSDCVLELGDCTEDASKVRDRIQSAFDDGCSKCSGEELEELKVIFKDLVENKPDNWKQLKDKLDSDGSKKNNYESLLP